MKHCFQKTRPSVVTLHAAHAPAPNAGRRAAGFTLVELMVVISIIALLIGILLPALGSAREVARTSTCLSGMRQWGIALQAYLVNEENTLPRIEGVGASAAAQNTTPDAWFNVLPSLVSAPKYGDIYSGGDVGVAGGYTNAWIWYCPSRIQEGNKNSGSGKNSFHYGMNTVINGTASLGPKTAERINVDTIGVSLQKVVYMSEPFNNQPYVRPDSLAGSGGNVEWDRHAGTQVNMNFLDGHVTTLESKGNANKITSDNPYYQNTDLGIIWGVFGK